MTRADRFPRTPLTTRGWLLLALALYLLFVPGRREADIVATAFAFGILALISLLGAAILFEAVALQRKLKLKLSVPEKLYSGDEQNCTITLPPLRLLPLLVLELRLTFRHRGATSLTHLVAGRWDSGHVIAERITFPHRGDWGLGPWALAVTDRLGLTRWRWMCERWEGPASLTVLPPETSSTDLPLLSSATRTGDDIIEQHVASGEPFDLKPYHPSDGMKKIVWKVFAKTGQLISRHPERAMTPEGKVLLFALAGPEDDAACGLILDYCRRAASLDLSIIAGCLGMDGREVAPNETALRTLLLDSVWDSDGSVSTEMLEEFLAAADRHLMPSRCTRILLFSTGKRLSHPGGTAEAQRVGDFLQARGIEPVFFIAGKQERRRKVAQQSLLSRFLFGRTRQAPSFDPQAVPALAGTKNWAVHLARN